MSIYLIQSKSLRLLNEELDLIIKKSNNVTYTDLINSNMTDILEEAAYFSLFDEIKYIVVKNANVFGSEKLKDSESDSLMAYMDNPNPSNVLIFCTSNKIDSRKVLVKKLKEKYTIKIINDLKPYEVVKKIDDYFHKQKYKYSKDISNYISSSCLNDYDLVYNELLKIDSYYEDDKALEFSAIEKIVSRYNEDNNFKLIDAITTKNIVLAFRIFDDLKIAKVEPTVIVALLAREYRMMYNAKIAMKSGMSNIDIAKALGLQDWQLDKAIRKAYEYSVTELEDNLLKIFDMDLAIKSNNTNKYLPLDIFILNL